ncbi:unnamed protein product [Cuscuta epithymum]|uniref:Uncharacterized protein n=1 Tax=Cuscuta epithymum TaxID=186058 RepID=A0AAV0FUX8_9ASTE|nr:unnamed protein product [Cuscuta epithymum]
MEASAYPRVCAEMNRVFHTIDRQLYSILVFQLHTDPNVAAFTIALWVWLEHVTLSSLVGKIKSSSLEMIKGLANEAVFVLRCITAVDPPHLPSHFSFFSISPATSDPEISLTQALVGKHLSLDFLRQNRAAAAFGIKKVVNGGCVRALKDLMEMASATPQTARQLDSPSASSSSSRSVPGPLPRALGFSEVPRDRRSLFATFLRGFPVGEEEIKSFFKDMFDGRECVEAVSMQPVKQPNQQPLFGVIVFTTPGIIHFVLNGTYKVKLSINGKPVRVRKYIPKPAF